MDDSDDKIDPADKAVWDDYVSEHDCQKSSEENFEELLKQAENQGFEEDIEQNTPATPLEKTIVNPQLPRKYEHPAQLDRRTEERLRKGQFAIEARLDLHGLSKERAYEVLEHFIKSSTKRNLRHVLVITGKGLSKKTADEWFKPSEGVLKNNVPQWLNEKAFKPYVLRYMEAQPKDGGSGALYIYLKRKR